MKVKWYFLTWERGLNFILEIAKFMVGDFGEKKGYYGSFVNFFRNIWGYICFEYGCIIDLVNALEKIFI